jgi:hypothetical protein
MRDRKQRKMSLRAFQWVPRSGREQEFHLASFCLSFLIVGETGLLGVRGLLTI